MVQEKNRQVFIGPILKEGRWKSIQTIQSPSYSPVYEEFENVGFVSVVPTECVSRTFVYDIVNVNKIIIISTTKLPSYPYEQVITGLTVYLGCCANLW